MKKSFAAAGAALLLIIAGIYVWQTQSAADKKLDEADTLPAPSHVEKSDPFLKRAVVMSIEEKAGQVLMVSIEGTRLSEETAVWLRSHHIGGVILLGKNVSTRPQVIALTSQIQQNARNPEEPYLFIAADQEGGTVSRFRFFAENTAEKDIADEKQAFDIAFGRGRAMKELGVNINFAPVLDIASSPQDFIYSRTFEKNAEETARLGNAMIRGYERAGMIATAKHFPGHGGTKTDSHATLPVLELSDEAYNKALLPFREAVKANTGMIMMGHILMPRLDQEKPASISPVFISDELRHTLGYEGVVITDDMGMGAIIKRFDVAKASLFALQAGADIVLVVRSIADYNKIYEEIIRAVAAGELSEKRLNESVARILRLKSRFGLLPR